MQKIEQYKANDGTIFDNEDKCLKYEKMLTKLDALFDRLPKVPDDRGCSFANGGGYIQHERGTFMAVSDEFYRLACSYHKGLREFLYNSYGFWRTLNDSGSIFYRNKYGGRLMNTDEGTMREYGQGYYKTHPDEVKGGQINVEKKTSPAKRKLNADEKEVANLLG